MRDKNRHDCASLVSWNENQTYLNTLTLTQPKRAKHAYYFIHKWLHKYFTEQGESNKNGCT